MTSRWYSRGGTPSPDASSSTVIFDGSSVDVRKFFFYYENVAISSKTEEERALGLLGFLDGEAFDFYYETYAEDGSLAKEAKNYNAVKSSLIDRFGPSEGPEEKIRRAVSSLLNYSDLFGSMKEMDSCFEKAGFNSEAKFGLLRQAVMEFAELAQFVMFRGAEDYSYLKEVVKLFVSGKKTLGLYGALNVLPPAKHVLQRPKKEPQPSSNVLEDKVNEISDQLAQLSLMMKKTQSSQHNNRQSGDRICSYCKQSGHISSRCELNPHRDTRCSRCGKLGHSVDTCWKRQPNENIREVKFENAKSESQLEEKLRLQGIPSSSAPEKRSNHVSVITEPEHSELVNTTKRTAEGSPLPKQPRTGELSKISPVIFPSSLPTKDRMHCMHHFV